MNQAMPEAKARWGVAKFALEADFEYIYEKEGLMFFRKHK